MLAFCLGMRTVALGMSVVIPLFPRVSIWWFIAGEIIAIALLIYAYVKIMKARTDMSISIDDYRDMRAAEKAKRRNVRDQ